jgi:hypothetical protein
MLKIKANKRVWMHKCLWTESKLSVKYFIMSNLTNVDKKIIYHKKSDTVEIGVLRKAT